MQFFTAETRRRRGFINKISGVILDACITVHKIMGPGLLESIYEQCLMKEIELRTVMAINQVPISLLYKGYELSRELKVDILVENEIILELKSAEIMHPVYEAQLISYLKLTNKKLGFLVNFNVGVLKNGFKRYVNNF
ncbi:MAG: GxxExxY protein [Bacteroidales bacterium]|nr:GxxExxY protein [Bacteroidales bacterium]